MSALATELPAASTPGLTEFETEFVRTVLEHRGSFRRPSHAEWEAAFEVLQRFDDEAREHPIQDDGYAPTLDSVDMAALRAKAYLMFGTLRPTPAQWHKAHTALFGPMMCEQCG